MRLFRFGAGRLDDVGINRALPKPFGLRQLGLFELKYIDEYSANDLTFLLRIDPPGQMPEKFFASVDMHHPYAEILCQSLQHLLGLVQAQQAIVDEYAGKAVANGAVNECRCDRRIDSTRQTEYHLLASDLPADAFHRLFGVVRHVPVVTAAADVVHETFEDRFALQGD